jgi:hypothetical protein
MKWLAFALILTVAMLAHTLTSASNDDGEVRCGGIHSEQPVQADVDTSHCTETEPDLTGKASRTSCAIGSNPVASPSSLGALAEAVGS